MQRDNDVHHRKPKSRGGTNEARNLSIVPIKKHNAWHRLFANYDPPMIAKIINDSWLDPDYYLVAIPRKKRKSNRGQLALVATCECGMRCEIQNIPVAVLKKRVPAKVVPFRRKAKLSVVK